MNSLLKLQDCIKHLKVENQKLKFENEQLRLEISKLKNLGKKNDELLKIETTPNVEKTSNNLTLEERVNLFHSLFKGREDVFARRWFSQKTKQTGYQPVCENEWNYSLCNKKKYKCANCPNRKFKPLSYNDIYNHLAGKNVDGRDVIGCYAILENNKCHFLCADFDDKSCKNNFKEDVLSFVNVCKLWKIPFSIERSRSGNGAHVWIFFSETVEAFKARKLGAAILTEAMNRSGKMSFQSYDRFFPNQDKLPEGGFGNLVALPLQGLARKQGNSVFVDENFNVLLDQWTYLQNVQKLSVDEVDLQLKIHGKNVDYCVDEFSKSSESKPWETPSENLLPEDFPPSIEIVKSDMLYVSASYPARLLNYFKRIASFKNPKYFANLNMRLPIYNIPRVITCANILENYIAYPRGCEDKMVELLRDKNVDYKIFDKTFHGHVIDVQFKSVLRDEQSKAMNELLKHNTGVLHGTTAFGKTVTAIGLIAERKTNTLILVHTKALLNQWIERLEQFLDHNFAIEETPKKRGRKKMISPFGSLDSRGDKLTGNVDVALLQSCVNNNEVKPFVKNYGMVIVDECHHVSAVNFEQVLKQVKAQFVYGLTATPLRKDGHQPIIFMQCGPIRFTANFKQQMAAQTFDRYLEPRFTTFRIVGEENPGYTLIAQKILQDEMRNQLIVNDVCNCVKDGRTPMVLTTRTAHVEILSNKISAKGIQVVTLVGSEKAKEKKAKMDLLKNATSPLVIVAIDKYVGEGFDYPRLDTLFMTMPLSWQENIKQYVGRLHRDFEGKTEVKVYDYIDIHIPMCNTMYKKRMKGYKASGYKIAQNDNAIVVLNNTLFTEKDFEESLHSDILQAENSVILILKDTYINKSSKSFKLLPAIIAKGISVVAFAKKSSSRDNLWTELGISLKIQPSLTLQGVIIDSKIVWYGDVNVFGFNKDDENILRIKDAALANEMQEILCKDALGK